MYLCPPRPPESSGDVGFASHRTAQHMRASTAVPFTGLRAVKYQAAFRREQPEAAHGHRLFCVEASDRQDREKKKQSKPGKGPGLAVAVETRAADPLRLESLPVKEQSWLVPALGWTALKVGPSERHWSSLACRGHCLQSASSRSGLFTAPPCLLVLPADTKPRKNASSNFSSSDRSAAGFMNSSLLSCSQPARERMRRSWPRTGLNTCCLLAKLRIFAERQHRSTIPPREQRPCWKTKG